MVAVFSATVMYVSAGLFLRVSCFVFLLIVCLFAAAVKFCILAKVIGARVWSSCVVGLRCVPMYACISDFACL